MVLASLQNWRAQWFPPKPKFTEQDVPPQNERVFLVTGGSAGIGYELVRMLYGTGATVYMTSRSTDRAESAIKTITSIHPQPSNPGTIKSLCLDLNDLESVKQAAETFSQQESRLDVLWNNAGTGGTAVQFGARTKQGLESMVGMHCVAALLFTQLLIPRLRAAVASSPSRSCRVVWTSSFLAEAATPTNGIDFEFLKEGSSDRVQNYAVSKMGNWMLSREMATRYAEDGIISISQNPGNLKAGAYDGTPAVAMFLMKFVLHHPKFGAYTELYSGLSPDITAQHNGCYVIPWGRIRSDNDCPRRDIIRAMTPQSAGGLGYTGKFWDWCERQWQPFVGDISPG
jgi:NAD(P)-dependent dehydrogenase (short-subunit alcohol dehydrogenase family)